jgi:hypothetical protein
MKFIVDMTCNLRFRHLRALDCGQYIKFVDQVTGSARNGAHWVRMTSDDPNNLKFGIWVF